MGLSLWTNRVERTPDVRYFPTSTGGTPRRVPQNMNLQGGNVYGGDDSDDDDQPPAPQRGPVMVPPPPPEDDIRYPPSEVSSSPWRGTGCTGRASTPTMEEPLPPGDREVQGEVGVQQKELLLIEEQNMRKQLEVLVLEEVTAHIKENHVTDEQRCQPQDATITRDRKDEPRTESPRRPEEMREMEGSPRRPEKDGWEPWRLRPGPIHKGV